jgi:hypothetical protein
MDLTTLLFKDETLHPRKLSKDELEEMERQLRMQASWLADPSEVRRKQVALHNDPNNKKWWEYPLLNRPYTRQLRQPMEYGPRLFSTSTPVVLDKRSVEEQNKKFRKWADEDEARERAKISNPMLRAWQYLQDEYLNGKAY